MEDDFEEMGNLMDDDPALDYILYEEMEQKRGEKGGGCLGVMTVLILPFFSSVYWLVV